MTLISGGAGFCHPIPRVELEERVLQHYLPITCGQPKNVPMPHTVGKGTFSFLGTTPFANRRQRSAESAVLLHPRRLTTTPPFLYHEPERSIASPPHPSSTFAPDDRHSTCIHVTVRPAFRHDTSVARLDENATRTVLERLFSADDHQKRQKTGFRSFSPVLD